MKSISIPTLKSGPWGCAGVTRLSSPHARHHLETLPGGLAQLADGNIADNCRVPQTGLVLHYLPTYAPEANPIERVWWCLHEQITRGHRCQTMEELLDLIFAWLQQRTRFMVEDGANALPPAA